MEEQERKIIDAPFFSKHFNLPRVILVLVLTLTSAAVFTTIGYIASLHPVSSAVLGSETSSTVRKSTLNVTYDLDYGVSCPVSGYNSLEECKKKYSCQNVNGGSNYFCQYPPGKVPNGQTCLHDSECKSNYCTIYYKVTTTKYCENPPKPVAYKPEFYNQRTYKNISWKDVNGNICESHSNGCGPFAAANILSYYKGKKYTPEYVIANYYNNKSTGCPDGVSDVDNANALLKNNVKEAGSPDVWISYYGYTGSRMRDKDHGPYKLMKQYLDKGYQILAMVNSYDGQARFRHYIWIKAIKGSIDNPQVISDDSWYSNKPNYVQPLAKQYVNFQAFKF